VAKETIAARRQAPQRWPSENGALMLWRMLSDEQRDQVAALMVEMTGATIALNPKYYREP
jgi:hypothetical protein